MNVMRGMEMTRMINGGRCRNFREGFKECEESDLNHGLSRLGGGSERIVFLVYKQESFVQRAGKIAVNREENG